MCIRVLIMGLPGSGKTSIADDFAIWLRSEGFTVDRLNADELRTIHNDWDFSIEGRIRQAHRMYDLAAISTADCVVADFVAALPEQRDIFNPDYLIWMDTIEYGRYDDTNKAFIPPTNYTTRINKW